MTDNIEQDKINNRRCFYKYEKKKSLNSFINCICLILSPTLGQLRSISLLFSDIEEDAFHNKLDKKVAKNNNGKFYVITNEKSDSILRKPYSWLVTKKYFLYFAQPYGKS